MIYDIVGYAAAIFSNVSIYPQAYIVCKLISKKKYSELKTISSVTYIFFFISSILWFIYAYKYSLYPIYLGSIICIIPTIYILSTKCIYSYILPVQSIQSRSQALTPDRDIESGL